MNHAEPLKSSPIEPKIRAFAIPKWSGVGSGKTNPIMEQAYTQA